MEPLGGDNELEGHHELGPWTGCGSVAPFKNENTEATTFIIITIIIIFFFIFITLSVAILAL